jgi:hypothetical protein
MGTVPGQGPFPLRPDHEPPPMGDMDGKWAVAPDGQWWAFYASNVGPITGRMWSKPCGSNPHWYGFRDDGRLDGAFACRHGAVIEPDGTWRDGPCGERYGSDGTCGDPPGLGISDEEFEEFRQKLEAAALPALLRRLRIHLEST